MKILNYKSTEPIFFQDMAVGGDLEFLHIVVIADSPTGQRIAIQIIKIGILLLKIGPQLVVLAGICPHMAVGLNRRSGGLFGDDAPVDQVEDSDAIFRQVWIPLYCYEEPHISVRGDESGSSFPIVSRNEMRFVPDGFEAFVN